LFVLNIPPNQKEVLWGATKMQEELIEGEEFFDAREGGVRFQGLQQERVAARPHCSERALLEDPGGLGLVPGCLGDGAECGEGFGEGTYLGQTGGFLPWGRIVGKGEGCEETGPEDAHDVASSPTFLKNYVFEVSTLSWGLWGRGLFPGFIVGGTGYEFMLCRVTNIFFRTRFRAPNYPQQPHEPPNERNHKKMRGRRVIEAKRGQK
jgi:hypothetical protein